MRRRFQITGNASGPSPHGVGVGHAKAPWRPPPAPLAPQAGASPTPTTTLSVGGTASGTPSSLSTPSITSSTLPSLSSTAFPLSSTMTTTPIPLSDSDTPTASQSGTSIPTSTLSLTSTISSSPTSSLSTGASGSRTAAGTASVTVSGTLTVTPSVMRSVTVSSSTTVTPSTSPSPSPSLSPITLAYMGFSPSVSSISFATWSISQSIADAYALPFAAAAGVGIADVTVTATKSNNGGDSVFLQTTVGARTSAAALSAASAAVVASNGGVSGSVSTAIALAAGIPSLTLNASSPPAPAVTRAISVSNGFQMTLHGVTAATLQSSPDAQAALVSALALAAGVSVGDISLTGINAKDDGTSSIVSIVLHSTLVNLMTSSGAVTNAMALNVTAYSKAILALSVVSSGIIGTAVTNSLRDSGISTPVAIVATPLGGVTPLDGAGFAWPYALSSTMMNSDASLAAGISAETPANGDGGGGGGGVFFTSAVAETGLISGIIMMALTISFIALRAERAYRLKANTALEALAFERKTRGAALGAPKPPIGKPPVWAWSDFNSPSAAVVQKQPSTTLTGGAISALAATPSKITISALTSGRQTTTSVRGLPTIIEGMTDNPLRRSAASRV